MAAAYSSDWSKLQYFLRLAAVRLILLYSRTQLTPTGVDDELHHVCLVPYLRMVIL